MRSTLWAIWLLVPDPFSDPQRTATVEFLDCVNFAGFAMHMANPFAATARTCIRLYISDVVLNRLYPTCHRLGSCQS